MLHNLPCSICFQDTDRLLPHSQLLFDHQVIFPTTFVSLPTSNPLTFSLMGSSPRPSPGVLNPDNPSSQGFPYFLTLITGPNTRGQGRIQVHTPHTQSNPHREVFHHWPQAIVEVTYPACILGYVGSVDRLRPIQYISMYTHVLITPVQLSNYSRSLEYLHISGGQLGLPQLKDKPDYSRWSGQATFWKISVQLRPRLPIDGRLTTQKDADC